MSRPNPSRAVLELMRFEAIERALKVLVYDYRIRKYLTANDPKALEQADLALAPIKEGQS